MSVETASAALVRVTEPLEPRRAATLRESFGVMFDRVEAWQTEAAGLLVTAEDQVGRMKRARLLRLEIKDARVALDKKRKELKASVLVEGRAIDGAFAVFEGLAAPLEAHLRDQETFAERAEAARRDALMEARQAALLALETPLWEIPPDLGDLGEGQWIGVLALAQEARKKREEKARADAEAHARGRAEAERFAAEARKREVAQRVENARLRAEADAREEVLAEERRAAERAQAKAATERKARLAAEAKVAEERTARVQAEKQNSRETKTLEGKYNAAVAALRTIARGTEPKAVRLARAALKAIEEA
jgi:hypothetical protein